MSSDFQREYEIINKAVHIIEDEENYENINFRSEYKDLTKNYKRLLRQLVKLTTISDKLQNKLILAQDELKELIITDSLTNLNNRRKLDETLLNGVEIANKTGHPFSIIILDIDKFKSVNDVFGHHIGDTVLIEFSNLIKTNVNKTDILGRWGGEEFMIISPGNNLGEAAEFAEKLRNLVFNCDFSVVGKKTASFGVAQFMQGESVEELIIRADEALYSAKEKGRNCVETAN